MRPPHRRAHDSAVGELPGQQPLQHLHLLAADRTGQPQRGGTRPRPVPERAAGFAVVRRRPPHGALRIARVDGWDAVRAVLDEVPDRRPRRGERREPQHRTPAEARKDPRRAGEGSGHRGERAAMPDRLAPRGTPKRPPKRTGRRTHRSKITLGGPPHWFRGAADRPARHRGGGKTLAAVHRGRPSSSGWISPVRRASPAHRVADPPSESDRAGHLERLHVPPAVRTIVRTHRYRPYTTSLPLKPDTTLPRQAVSQMTR